MKKILLGFIAIGLLTFVGCGTSSPVKIGKQEWMSENLNVDHFRNGEIIPEVKTEEEWKKARKENRAAWCYYENDISKYGKLYNWYAVSDPRGLAPEGWHVPTDAEWTVLEDYLADNGHNGAALKATSGWMVQDSSGTDDYEWNGLPGGYRGAKGGFYDVGNYGYWWSSSESNTSSAWNLNLSFSFDDVDIDYSDKSIGFSVRCLRN